MKDKITKNLDRVLKPSRYIGNELGSIIKPADEVDLRVALVFPEVYEIGISNLGVRILYKILNNMPRVQAERVYAPWPDMESVMRRENIPPCGLECGTSLGKFDIVGFSLQYELLYTNVLNILDLAEIPFFACERDGNFPLIIAGGPCVFNPEPVADFFDALLIGDGEKAVIEIAESYRKWTSGNNPEKKSLLDELSKIEGVYIPSFFKPEYSDDGNFKSVIPLSRKREVVKNIVSEIACADSSDNPLIPYCEAVHDRVNIEIMRGCSSGCRFCQAGIIYRPVRERGKSDIIKKAVSEIEKTGYGDLALCSLNVAGHSGIEEIVSCLVKILLSRKVSISLPSLRANILKSGVIAESIAKVRKTGFTIAPEAGTQRLRDIINKGISEDEIIDSALTAFSKGWQSLKLYFMIGLPFETDDDVRGIADLVWKIVDRVKGAGKRIKRLSVSISPFVPKAHTPFQWCEMAGRDEIERKIGIILHMMKSKMINIEWHDPKTSILEGAFARGDRRLSKIIVSAFGRGAKFDGWGEHFSPEIWEESFEEYGLDLGKIAARKIGFDEVLPWEHINCGVKKEFFLEEYKKAKDGALTQDCSLSGCKNCGLENACLDVKKAKKEEEFQREDILKNEESASADTSSDDRERYFYRIKYSKKGLMKFLSHSEFRNLFERAAARAKIPVAFSRGFHPYPCISYGMPLSVGVAGEGEYLDIELFKGMNPEEIMREMNLELPKNIRVLDAVKRKSKRPSVQSSVKKFVYEVAFDKNLWGKMKNTETKLKEMADAYEKASDFIVERERKNGSSQMDLKKHVLVQKQKDEGDNDNISYKIEVEVTDGRAPSIYLVIKEVFGIDVNDKDSAIGAKMPHIVRSEIIFLPNV